MLPFLFLLYIGNKSWGVRTRNFPGDPVGGKMKKMFQMYNLIFFLFFQTKENGRTFSIKISRGCGGGWKDLEPGGGGGVGFTS